jgi:class 3 adenylate cyclase
MESEVKDEDSTKGQAPSLERRRALLRGGAVELEPEMEGARSPPKSDRNGRTVDEKPRPKGSSAAARPAHPLGPQGPTDPRVRAPGHDGVRSMTLLFLDIVDSTALTEQLGDDAFRRRSRKLDQHLRSLVVEHHGRPVEEPQRAQYEADISWALGEVTGWFLDQGFQLPAGPVVKEIVVLGDTAEARRAVAARAGVPEGQVPDTFSGTVDGETLLVVSREGYAATFQRMYPQEVWSEGEYRRLAAHELAHRAHELVVIAATGSSEGMGPVWFFEGLALACAGQFPTSSPGGLSPSEVRALIEQDERKPLGYPRYADMFRSMARAIPVKELVARAGKPDFTESIGAAGRGPQRDRSVE